MNRSETPSSRGLRAIGSILLALLLLAAFTASAQDITVTSADPAETEQGTLSLVVKIAGSNFGKDSKVDFLVSGTTDPGGITVKSVKYRNPKSLEATIDVAPDAQTRNRFDIRVQSGGRTGKGTELFKVLEKVTGGDLTPPGIVTDLKVVEGQVGFNTAYLTWTAPANDGYDASSGPAALYDLRVRKADCGPFTMDIWVDDTLTGIRNDPCHIYYARPVANAPGTQESLRVSFLAPETEYWVALRTVDASPQGPNWSALPDPSLQLRFRSGPYPPEGESAPWIPEIVDACPVLGTACRMYAPPRLDFDGDGYPAIFYIKQVPTLARRTISGWVLEPAPIAVDDGNWNYDFAMDPWSGEATVSSLVPGVKPELRVYRRTAGGWTTETIATGTIGANALGFAPGSPNTAVAYLYTKGGSTTLRVAERLGYSWSTATVAASVTGALAPSIAFDDAARPAVTFSQEVSGTRRLAFALRNGAAWTIEQAGASPGAPWSSLNDTRVAFDPSRNDFAAVGRYYDAATSDSRIEFCRRASGNWSCEPVVEGNSLGGLAFAIDGAGTVFISYMQSRNFRMLVRTPGSQGWNAEFIDWNVWSAPPGDLRIGPDGLAVMAYGTAHDWTYAGGSDLNYSVSVAWRAPAPGQ